MLNRRLPGILFGCALHALVDAAWAQSEVDAGAGGQANTEQEDEGEEEEDEQGSEEAPPDQDTHGTAAAGGSAATEEPTAGAPGQTPSQAEQPAPAPPAELATQGEEHEPVALAPVRPYVPHDTTMIDRLNPERRPSAADLDVIRKKIQLTQERGVMLRRTPEALQAGPGENAEEPAARPEAPEEQAPAPPSPLAKQQEGEDTVAMALTSSSNTQRPRRARKGEDEEGSSWGWLWGLAGLATALLIPIGLLLARPTRRG